MNPFRPFLIWLLVIGPMGALVAQETEPYPRISEEAFKGRVPFFDYDASIPLEARVVREWDNGDAARQKIVFRGAQGHLVPGYLEVPKSGSRPYPIVLLLHGWSGGKENWYERGNYINGEEMREALIASGFATFALDAATHGERSNEIDYLDVNVFEDPEAPARRNYFTFAEITIQTVKDYRRALDVLAQRDEIDLNRIGVLGYSMGGMDAIILLAVDARIQAAVACVPPLVGASYGPAAPIDYTWGIGKKPFLMLMGRHDELYDPARAEASYYAYIESPESRLIWYDRDHKLTSIYIPDAMEWLRERLKN